MERSNKQNPIKHNKKDFAMQHVSQALNMDDMQSEGSALSAGERGRRNENRAYYVPDDDPKSANGNGSIEDVGFNVDETCMEDVDVEDMESDGVISKCARSSSANQLQSDMQKYKKDLKACNSATKGLEKKFMQINFELNELQHKHQRFIAHRKMNDDNEHEHEHEHEVDCGSLESNNSSINASADGLPREYSKSRVFGDNGSFVAVLDGESSQVINKSSLLKDRQSKRLPRHSVPVEPLGLRAHNKYINCMEDFAAGDCGDNGQLVSSQDIKNIYNVLNMMLATSTNSNNNSYNQRFQASSHFLGASGAEDMDLIVEKFQLEREKFQKVINDQKRYLQEYHVRCSKAQKIIQAQQLEIEKLNSNNQNLESEIIASIEKLRLQVESKIEDTAVQKAKLINSNERMKFERIGRENQLLCERLRKLQKDVTDLKSKMQAQTRNKHLMLSKLKLTQRDVKVFRDHNESLKHEKQYLHEELKKVKGQLNANQTSSKRTITRQTEALEKQRRVLQKHVIELGSKLNRSQTLSTNLIQERDRTIAELRTQLNSMVHNFELSQKHNRLLRRQICLGGGQHTAGAVVTNTIKSVQ